MPRHDAAKTPLDASALTLLVDILDAGHLSQAARKLKMTQANVSCPPNQLERSVGMQLVRRTTRRVEPTEAGRACCSKAGRFRAS